MHDWSKEIEEAIAPLNLSAAREAEIVEELSQHLNDRYDELLVAGTGEEQACRILMEDLTDGRLVAGLKGTTNAATASGSGGQVPEDRLLSSVRNGLGRRGFTVGNAAKGSETFGARTAYDTCKYYLSKSQDLYRVGWGPSNGLNNDTAAAKQQPSRRCHLDRPKLQLPFPCPIWEKIFLPATAAGGLHARWKRYTKKSQEAFRYLAISLVGEDIRRKENLSTKTQIGTVGQPNPDLETARKAHLAEAGSDPSARLRSTRQVERTVLVSTARRLGFRKSA